LSYIDFLRNAQENCFFLTSKNLKYSGKAMDFFDISRPKS
jgi:hypothetical protein